MSIAGIRFLGLSTPEETNVPIPPSGRAFLFYNNSLNVFRARLDDGSYITLNITQEMIEDIIGNLINSSSTIVANYDDPANQLFLEIANNSIQTVHVNQISPVKIGDSQNIHIANALTTTDASLTEIASFTMPADGTYSVSAKWSAIRTAGLSGSPGDGASFLRHCRIKKWGAANVLDVQSTYTSRDGGFNILIGTTPTQIKFYVVGKTNQEIKWSFDADIHFVTI